MLPGATRHQVALLAAVAFLAGCAGGERPSGASAGEIQWLKSLNRWELAMGRAVEGLSEQHNAVLAGDSYPVRLELALERVRACTERLRRRVGDPPGRKYRAGFALFNRACRQWHRFADELERSLEKSPGDHLVSAGQAQSEASELVASARREIEDDLTASRDLPRVGGTTERSRIEPRFSRVASALVGRKVNMVCWSRSEWRKAVAEWGAYIGNTDFAAFADVADDQAYLGPEACAGLVDLAYRGRRPGGGEDKERLASAVSTLSHEAEHLVAAAAGEAETECYGMQDMRRVGRMLGATPAYAGELAELYWEDVYETLPDDYVDPDCRDAGPWDRNDASAVWP